MKFIECMLDGQTGEQTIAHNGTNVVCVCVFEDENAENMKCISI